MPQFSSATRPLLLVTALFAMCWAIARAAVQSITIDEASSYLVFVRHADLHFYPAANNHLLNTLLEWFSTRLFGLHHLTVRAPALLGAALYISASYRLCRTIGEVVQWPLFVCLVFNPFVFDYLVAARGYGLALGFLMWAIAAVAVPQAPSLTRCAVASACLALSLASNLSFGIVDGVTLVGVFVAAYLRDRSRPARLLSVCIAPALLITALLTGSFIPHMSKRELWWGANSLAESFSSILQASLYRPYALDGIKYYVPTLLAIALVAYAAYRLSRAEPLEERERWLGRFSAAIAAILVVTLTVHWAAFRLIRLLLPTGRTGLYIAPLAVLVAGGVAAIPSRRVAGVWLRRSLITMLFATAGYFLLCMRLNYFKEWEFDADAQDLYSVLACLNHDRDARNVGTYWMYADAFNFYREQSGRETFPEFETEAPFNTPYRPDQRVLALEAGHEKQTLDERGLRVIYKGKSTQAVIAVTPDLEASLRSSRCLADSPP
jgi:hypothetical protein